MFLKDIYKDPIPRYAWRRLALLWKPMAGWTLLVWFSVAIILVPVFSSLLGWGVFRGEQLVVGNEELISWLVTPRGAIYALLAGSLALIGGIIRYAGLFQIVTDDLEHRPVSIRGTALRIAPLIPKLFRLSLMAILASIVLLLPLLAGLGGLYVYFLGEHDINYYLSLRPPEWNQALIAAGIWSFLWFLGAAWLFCRTLLILPAFLSGEPSIRNAIKQSWYLPQHQAHRLLGLMGVSLGLWLLANIIVDVFFLFSAGFIIEWVANLSNSLRTLVLVTGLYTAISIMLGILIGFLGFSFASTVLTKFFYESIGVHIKTRSSKKLSRLPAKSLVYVRYWFTTSRVIPLFFILFSASLVISNFMLERIPDQKPVLISAHRAGPPPSPENTLAALEAAINTGAEYTEIDVQRTRDGVVVLLHDADLMRVTGDSRRVDQLTYSELSDLVQVPDDGSPDLERRIVSLEDFMARAEGRIRLMIELKFYGPDPELAAEVVRLVQNRNMEDEVMLMSMNMDAVVQLAAIAPDIPRGFVSALAVGDLTRLPVDFLAIAHARINPQLIRTASQQGIDIYAWTVNRTDIMADMMELGVNGIITDDPALGVRVRDELSTMTPAERILLRFRKVLTEDLH